MCLKSEHVDSRMAPQLENMKKQKVSKNLWKNSNREKWSRRKRRREEWQKAERGERVSHKNIGINCKKKKKKSFTPIHQSEARDKLITINQLWVAGRADLMREAERVLNKFPRRAGSISKTVGFVVKTEKSGAFQATSTPLLTHFLGSLFRSPVPSAPHADQHYSTYSSIFSLDLHPLNPALMPQIIDT